MARIPALVVNLPEDTERLASIKQQLDPILFDFIGNFGVLGRTLPDQICLALTCDPNSVNHKGALGVMLSHLAIWERVAALSAPYALIVEDDVKLINLGRLAFSAFPPDFDYIFCGDQTALHGKDPAVTPLTFIDAKDVFPFLAARKSAVGGYCYLLSPQGARNLLDQFRTRLYFGHVDTRMMGYACRLAELESYAEPAWLLAELRWFRGLIEDGPKLSAYASDFALAEHIGMASRRDREDELGRTLAPTA